MTVKEMAEKFNYRIVTTTEYSDRQVTGVYACDLLSHAMAKLNEGDVWVTVHTNLNVVAVASLTSCACVIIPENIEIDEQTVKRADEKGVVFLSSSKNAALICHEIISAIKGVQ